MDSGPALDWTCCPVQAWSGPGTVQGGPVQGPGNDEISRTALDQLDRGPDLDRWVQWEVQAVLGSAI